MRRQRGLRDLEWVLVWNMKVGRGRRAIRGLRRLIKRSRAQVILLQEAKNYVPAIRVAFPGWRVFGGPGFVESSNCVVMVRRGLEVTHHGRVRNRASWVFTGKGRHVVHPGRVWRDVVAEGVALLCVHKATEVLDKNGPNHDVGLEEANNLVEWLETYDHAIAAGDINNQHDDTRPNGPVEIAHDSAAKVHVPPGGENDPDFAWVRGLDVDLERLGDGGSDHHAWLIHITSKEHR